ncbi:hypothetical protein DEO72_LG7g914 [Vigna unguiculata]|uniref:Secreted protein n=1 Tax=Vigna unguiculata TaxID=3917 RepID=A0A4D6MFV2_VIGUN|nr:hypothetical protein DEO72_LG7g914 [Vigna unguiculata]
MAATLTFLLLQVHLLGCVVSRFPASCRSAVAGVMCGEDEERLQWSAIGTAAARKQRYSVVAPGGFAPAAFSGVAACALQRWFAVTVDLFWLTGALTMVSRWPWLCARCCCAVADGGGP